MVRFQPCDKVTTDGNGTVGSHVPQDLGLQHNPHSVFLQLPSFDQLPSLPPDGLLNPNSCIPNPNLYILNPKSSALNPQPSTLNPHNPQPSTLKPQPSTLNPEHVTSATPAKPW